MAIPSGLAGQIGFKSETTYATGVTVDQFLPFTSLGVETTYEQLVSMGIFAGRSTQVMHAAGRQTVGGSIECELYNRPTATLLKHMFGTVVDAGAGPYTHTATPVGGSLTGKSLTLQGGFPDVGGTVRPFTWVGVKIPTWTLSAAVGQIAKLQLGIVGKSENITGTPVLATSSFVTSAPFTFVHGAITIAGSSPGVIADISLTGDNGLNKDRFGLGGATISEPLEADRRAYTGTINTEFTDMTQYTRFTTGTAAALVCTFTNGADILAVTMNAYYGGGANTPKIDGPGGTLKLAIPFVCEHATADASAITAVLTNAEATST